LQLSGMTGMLDTMSSLSTFLSSGVNSLRDTLLPPTCVFCHSPVATYQACCMDCARTLHVWPKHVCHLCGKTISEDIAPGPCGHCLAKPPLQAQMLSLYTYAGPVRTAILAWKLQSDDAGLQWLIRTAEAKLETIFSPEDTLLPIPMPISRMRKAGCHHAADLCKMICKVTGSRMNHQILRRVGTQQRQSSLPRTERWNNLRKAFRVADDYPAHPGAKARLWIVDDIRTTGATLYYACRALKSLGHPVHAFSLARIADKE